jgi:hypothetical protein
MGTLNETGSELKLLAHITCPHYIKGGWVVRWRVGRVAIEICKFLLPLRHLATLLLPPRHFTSATLSLRHPATCMHLFYMKLLCNSLRGKGVTFPSKKIVSNKLYYSYHPATLPPFHSCHPLTLLLPLLHFTLVGLFGPYLIVQGRG